MRRLFDVRRHQLVAAKVESGQVGAGARRTGDRRQQQHMQHHRGVRVSHRHGPQAMSGGAAASSGDLIMEPDRCKMKMHAWKVDSRLARRPG